MFEEAMGRAISEVAEEQTLVECSPPSGMMSFGPSRGQNNCEGENMNAAIAARMDADQALQQAVRSILSVEWPLVDFTPKTLPSVPLREQETGLCASGRLSSLSYRGALSHRAELERRSFPSSQVGVGG